MTSPSIKTQNRSYAAKAVNEVLAQWGARFGLSWIGFLIIVAVFAPFIANSRPLLLSASGELSSPLFSALTPGDVTLMAVFFSVIALFFIKRLVMSQKVLAIIGIAIVMSLLTNSFMSNSKITIHEQHREAMTQGQYEWAIHTPIPYSPKDYLRDYQDTGLELPLSVDDRTHLFGTDENGADVLSRMIHASRVALGIGLVATGIALVIGVIIGGLMGYFSGIVDMIGMRLVEVFEAIPVIFLLLTFVAFFGRDLYVMMVIIGITGWTGYARFVRAEFLRLREQEFVQAAIACGLPLRSVLFRHMLPNGMAPVLVTVSFSVASAILAEATLSFLGLGPVDEPSWGQMLNQAVQAATFNWWMAIFPGGAIFMTMFAYMLIGEAMRDAIDPHLKKAVR